MGKIIILDENTANKIAAGEVIEKPASVIKELVENSIDAGATNISVDIRNGGISFIRVTDNGCGLEEDDVEIAFERHATSKIRRADDLESIKSMGFRGEALASIAAVSEVQLITRVKDAVQGIAIEVRGGGVKGLKPAGCPVGTTITIKDLFFNTPARYKFLKKDSTEAAYITDIMSRIALGYPDISFKLASNGSTVLHTPGNGDLKSVIFSIYGAETSKHLLKVDYKDEHVRITGYAGGAEMARSNRSQQLFYINGRTIRSKTITSALDGAYSTFLMKNKYAFAVLDIRINPASVDVNVHPSKMEVKFSNEQDIYRAVYHAVNGALLSQSSIRTLPSSSARSEASAVPGLAARPGSAGKSAYHLNEDMKDKPSYSQQDFEWVRKELDRKRAEAVAGGTENESFNAADKNFDSGMEGLYAGNKVESHKEDTHKEETQKDEGQKEERQKEECQKGVSHKEENTDGGRNDIVNDFAGQTNENNRDYNNIATHYQIEGKSTSIIAETGSENAYTEDMESSAKNAGLGTDFFKGIRVVGQVFSTYIILEGSEELFLLDQHAAHERIRYEELKKAYSGNEQFSQMLISAINIELSAAEYQFAIAEIPFFTKLGFTYESFGSNSVILRSVPFIDEGVKMSGLFMEILDFVMSGDNQDKSLIADEALYRMACKSAVKANRKLDTKEIDALLSGLTGLDNPFTCPHGRPAILRLRRYDMEKLFKRIV
ncbi:MAG TPA: DNA mismatch repair endonuclease MutL [Clostridia bacterium]|nr:DNA mismatch repair endonuclease MutL [Clostridia bacterium]